MLIVLSPAKTLDFDSELRTRKHSLPTLVNDSAELVAALVQKSPTDLGELMHLSPALADLNAERYQDWEREFTIENSRPALLAFKGDVYVGMDVNRYSERDFTRAQKTLRILSGLHGVLRPLDLIQPYRLEMGTKLINNKGKNLYEFWGVGVSEVLNEDESELIINLASNEYFKSIDKKALKADILNIAFKEKKGDIYKIIGIFAKRARGLMVNYIIRNRLNEPEALKDFTDEGYQFSSEFSDNATWVFTRG